MLARARRFAGLFALVFTCLFVAPQALSQDASTGAVRGSVTDATGGRIAGANIVLVNEATGFRYSIASDSEGRFAFDLLPAGEYSARATAEKKTVGHRS